MIKPVVAGIATYLAIPVALSLLPSDWTMRVTPACAVSPMRWVSRMPPFPAPKNSRRTERALSECYRDRGMYGASGPVTVVMDQWPTKDQIAEWNS